VKHTPFVWLGSNRTRKRGVGEKGRWLDQAAHATLPVPNGGILLDEFFRLALQEGIILLDEDTMTIPNPVQLHDLLYTAVRFPKLTKPVAVRPVFTLNNRLQSGQWKKHFVSADLSNAADLAKTLTAAWSLALPDHETIRLDLLIMERVHVDVEGTAVSASKDMFDQVTLASSPASKLQLPKLRARQRPQSDVPAFARRLQKLLRGIRRTFGTGDWRVTWADDGKICWLLQLEA
jgi:hypothetical protein